jgi:ribose transport system substrate-binding protein
MPDLVSRTTRITRNAGEAAISILFKLRAHEPVEVETLIPTTIYPLGNASATVPGPGAIRQSAAARPAP